ncbi:hypothetical protein ACFFLS_23660 [Flavobacterium procerum]|uniref:Lipoprotein n=1 Tax=Flavobacterium procerum TaxID=1455569 RepID=A0ABV6BX83_9FLAO
MKKSHFVLVILFIILSCQKKDNYSQLTYNQKANELIEQVLKNDSCNCLLEIPHESMIKISMTESPRFDIIRKKIMEKLNLEGEHQLDSLEKVSENFVLDSLLLKKNNITIFRIDSIHELTEDRSTKLIKKCPNGILYCTKPILNKDKTAVLFYGQAFNCFGPQLRVYNYKNEKWVYEKN